MAKAEAGAVSRIIGLQQRALLPLSTDGRVLLIGDAAHGMSPFMGRGGDWALFNALQAAEHVGAVGGRWREVVPEIEQQANRRAERDWQRSLQAAEDFHAQDAAERIGRYR